jgi:Mor family transcriptional regulator
MAKSRDEIDWELLKKEYMQGGTSYRKLAKKYDVSFQILQNVAKQEKWTTLLRRAKDETNTKLVNSIAKDNAKRMVKIDNIADKLLDKIEATLDALDVIDSQSIKHFTSALKDIKDIKGIKSDIDLAEQEARIDKLRKDTEDEQKDTDFEVVMGEEADSYAN